MRHYLLLLAGIAAASGHANAAEPLPSCAQIRAEISAQTGLLPKVNTELLGKLSDRADCKFTAAEAYRAAYGDKPIPKSEVGDRPRHDDDDD